MQIEIVTLFPEMIEQVAAWGVLGRALDRGVLKLNTRNPRELADDRHRTVDDRPYGGGPGMVLKVEPLRSCIAAARAALPQDGKSCPVVVLSAQGRAFDQACAREFADLPGMVLVAGRYEGIDERVMERDVDVELSLGDFVVSGGELPAMIVLDAVARILPGTLGDNESAEQDSFMNGLLDWPHYTRPEELDGQAVPDVLLSGDHAAVDRWRVKQALGRTWRKRPDLLEKLELSNEQRELLNEYITEHEQ